MKEYPEETQGGTGDKPKNMKVVKTGWYEICRGDESGDRAISCDVVLGEKDSESCLKDADTKTNNRSGEDGTAGNDRDTSTTNCSNLDVTALQDDGMDRKLLSGSVEQTMRRSGPMLADVDETSVPAELGEGPPARAAAASAGALGRAGGDAPGSGPAGGAKGAPASARTFSSSAEPKEILVYILDMLVRMDANQFFVAPVDDEIAPGYSKVITSPMDLLTMRVRAEADGYRTWKAFTDDFDLICSNAMTYNQKRSMVHKAAGTFLRNGRKLLQTHELSVRKSMSKYYKTGADDEEWADDQEDEEASVRPAGADRRVRFEELGATPSGAAAADVDDEGLADESAQLRLRSLSADDASSSFSDTQSELSGAEEAARSGRALEQVRSSGLFSAGASGGSDDSLSALMMAGLVPGGATKRRRRRVRRADVVPKELQGEWARNPRRKEIEFRCHWLETRIADLQSQIMNYDLQQIALRASRGAHSAGAQDAVEPLSKTGVDGVADEAEALPSRLRPVKKATARRRARWRRRRERERPPAGAEDFSAHPVLSLWFPPALDADGQQQPPLSGTGTPRKWEGGGGALPVVAEDEEELMRLADEVRAIQRGCVQGAERVRREIAEASQRRGVAAPGQMSPRASLQDASASHRSRKSAALGRASSYAPSSTDVSARHHANSLARSVSAPGGGERTFSAANAASFSQSRRRAADFDLNEVVMLAPTPQKRVAEIRAEPIHTPKFRLSPIQAKASPSRGNQTTRAAAHDGPEPVCVGPLEIPKIGNFDDDLDGSDYEDICDEVFCQRHAPLERHERDSRTPASRADAGTGGEEENGSSDRLTRDVKGSSGSIAQAETEATADVATNGGSPTAGDSRGFPAEDRAAGGVSLKSALHVATPDTATPA